MYELTGRYVRIQFSQLSGEIGYLPGIQDMVRALFLVEEGNVARRAVLRLCTAPMFDAFILAVILANACMMATEDPTQPNIVDPTRASLEIVCNVIFTAEMLAKVFAYGFVIGEGTYLRNGWNILVRLIAPRPTPTRLPSVVAPRASG